jgi:hypothetical protein
MDYRGVLTLDYSTPINPNEYARLLNALEQAGWEYAETSAMYIECDDIDPVLLALEVLARALVAPGQITAMNLQLQLVGQPRRPPAARNHRRALDKILDERALPSD